MSGASGKVPAAIHVTPECLAGGPLAMVRAGDVIRIDCAAGVLLAKVPAAEWAERVPDRVDVSASRQGLGRELFAAARTIASGAEQGAMIFGDALPA
jgi:phosphogluconate dehydratase